MNKLILLLLFISCACFQSSNQGGGSSSNGGSISTNGNNCGFERPPFISKFILSDKDVYFFGLHAKPDNVFYELNMLDDVIIETVGDYTSENVVALGDFNADCDYLSDFAYNSLDLVSRGFSFPIGKNADTNVASTSCAYDVFATHLFDISYSNPKIYSGISSNISDHFPIELSLVAGEQTYKVIAFNMQRYGPTKANDSQFISYVIDLVSGADITLLQEITSTDQSIMERLVPSGYKYAISSRLGSTSYKEQYMYVYKENLSLTDAYVYSGTICVPEVGNTNSGGSGGSGGSNTSNSCTSDGYYCGLDLYTTPGGQCRSRNKNGENKRVRDCCCGF